MILNKNMYPVNRPSIQVDDVLSVVKALMKKNISGETETIQEFEDKYKKHLNRNFAVTVSSGTAALQIAFETLDLKKGDEVILPSFAIISCLTPILKLGLKPIFIDADPETWNMDVKKTLAAINSKTRVILVVHTYGQCVDIEAIKKACTKKIMIIEDAAEAHGAQFNGAKAGTLGDLSIFSFYANKVITTGEGGMILTNDLELSERVRKLKNLAFQQSQRFIHNEVAGNYRLSSLQAALGISQLKKIDKYIKKREILYQVYFKALNSNESISFQPTLDPRSKNIYWVAGLKFKTKQKKDMFQTRAIAAGIQTRPFFYPLDMQPLLKKYDIERSKNKSYALELYETGLYLPFGNGYKKREIRKISRIIQKILADL
jgi:perosamine synthetase